MFRLASLFLTLALGNAILGFGGILTAYTDIPRLLFFVSVLMCFLMIMVGGIRHARLARSAPAPVPVRNTLPRSARR